MYDLVSEPQICKHYGREKKHPILVCLMVKESFCHECVIKGLTVGSVTELLESRVLEVYTVGSDKLKTLVAEH